MSTRAVIARFTGAERTGWAGRYVHCDGYPVGLGRELWNRLKRDPVAPNGVLRYLLDEHPAGWSYVGAGRDPLAECYCHPTRAGREPEGEQTITHENAAAAGCQWAYVCGEKYFLPDLSRTVTELAVLRRKAGGWVTVGSFPLNGPEPPWAALERGDERGELERGECWLIQDRTSCGDLVLWWKPNRCGHTTVLDDAGRYTEAEAREIERCRGTDMAVPERVALALARSVVPSDRLRETIASRGRVQ